MEGQVPPALRDDHPAPPCPALAVARHVPGRHLPPQDGPIEAGHLLGVVAVETHPCPSHPSHPRILTTTRLFANSSRIPAAIGERSGGAALRRFDNETELVVLYQ